MVVSWANKLATSSAENLTSSLAIQISDAPDFVPVSLIPDGSEEVYSVRNASDGSIRDARCAGR